jgi:2-hydroxycyclohexanecarboxyl-CoA dehydrogenase
VTGERRTALVTGGGSGIGRAIAHRLAEDGFATAVLDLNTEAAERVAEEARQKGHWAGRRSSWSTTPGCPRPRAS